MLTAMQAIKLGWISISGCALPTIWHSARNNAKRYHPFQCAVRMVPMSTISGPNNTTTSSKRRIRPTHRPHLCFPGAKVQMCKDEKGDRAWLNKVRPWWGHHYHFHVRLSCPAGATNCKNQAPPPQAMDARCRTLGARYIEPAPKSQCTKTETQTTPDIGATSTAMCWCFTVELSGLVILSK